MNFWHSIIRNGLKNYSNTKNQRNGNVFGNGIYLAKNSGTSYWYSEPSRSDTWPLSMFNRDDYYGRSNKNKGLYCLSLCEIVNHPKLKEPNPHYVVPTESWIITRYLFLFNTIDNNRTFTNGRYFSIDATKLIDNYNKFKLMMKEQYNNKKFKEEKDKKNTEQNKHSVYRGA